MTTHYMLFGFDNYYPSGGMHDHLATFTEFNYKTKTAYIRPNCDFYHIYDLETETLFDINIDTEIYKLRQKNEWPEDDYAKQNILRREILMRLIEEFIERE